MLLCAFGISHSKGALEYRLNRQKLPSSVSTWAMADTQIERNVCK